MRRAREQIRGLSHLISAPQVGSRAGDHPVVKAKKVETFCAHHQFDDACFGLFRLQTELGQQLPQPRKRGLGLLPGRAHHPHGWEQATEAEAAALVGWLRTARNPQRERRRSNRFAAGTVNPKTGKPVLNAGYAPATIAHNLSVVHGFYAFHIHFGRGPAANPIPENRARRAALAHISSMDRRRPHRRGRLRPKVTVRQPRAIPDAQWQELFSRLRCSRDRALLACYISSGARASELLAIRLPDVDWQGGKMWVVSKGTRARQPVPVSPEALAYLAAYLDEAGLPSDGGALWRTRRGDIRPLSYWAARRILQRAVEPLGMNWTLHDARHTAATRMARDPNLTLVEVQTILRHAHITTTALYTVTGLDDLIDKLAEHYQRPVEPVRWSAGYDPDDIAAVFGDQ
jgi:integrase